MDGMVEKSNQVLDHAAKMDRNGSLSLLFKKAKGIILISTVESAILVSGAVGTGVMFAKDSKTCEWSPPCACGMTATGWGFAVGAAVKDTIIFAFDDKSVQAFTSKVGLKMNVGTSITVGTYGVNAGANLSVSKTGAEGAANLADYGTGGTVSITFSKGAMLAAAVTGGVVGPRDHVNHTFYDNNKLSAQDILFHGKQLLEGRDIPALKELYNKIDLLTQGNVDHVISESPEKLADEIPDEATNFIDKIATEAIQQLDENPATATNTVAAH